MAAHYSLPLNWIEGRNPCVCVFAHVRTRACESGMMCLCMTLGVLSSSFLLLSFIKQPHATQQPSSVYSGVHCLHQNVNMCVQPQRGRHPLSEPLFDLWPLPWFTHVPAETLSLVCLQNKTKIDLIFTGIVYVHVFIRWLFFIIFLIWVGFIIIFQNKNNKNVFTPQTRCSSFNSVLMWMRQDYLGFTIKHC